MYTTVIGGITLLLALFEPSGRFLRGVAGGWGRFILWIAGVRVVITGVENLPRGPAIYAANHVSALDIPILFGHLPVDFRIIHKRSLYRVPFIGWHLFLGRHISIDRENPFKAKKSLVDAAQRIRGGTSVAVFPEGTRNRTGTLRPFKRGSFALAIASGAPVVPVSVAGVRKLTSDGLLRLKRGTVRVTIHPPVSTAGRSTEEAESLAEQVREVIRRECEA